MNELKDKIGNWLLDTRQLKGLDVRALSRLSGVNISLISRIENGLAIPTFPTLVRLCAGLDVNPDLFSEQLGLEKIRSKHLVRPDRSSYVLPGYLTLIDLVAFQSVYRFTAVAAEDDLVALWKVIIEKTPDFQGDSLEIATTQIRQATTPVSRSPIPYPPKIPNYELRDIFAEGGVIALSDAGYYMRACRQNAHLTLVDLQNSLHISRIVLGRMETGRLGRIQFDDVVKIDQYLEENGDILSMFWAAFEYHLGIEAFRLTIDNEAITNKPLANTAFRVNHLEDTLIRIARWYQAYPIKHNDRLWLDLERKKWEMAAMSTGLYGQVSPYDYIVTFDKVWEFFTPYLLKLCDDHPYPDDDTTDNISKEIRGLWAIFLKYLSTDPAYDAVRKSLLRHQYDLDFSCGVRSRFKEVWLDNDSLKDEVRQHLRHYYPGLLESLE